MCHSCHMMAYRKTLNFYKDRSKIRCSNPGGKCPLGIVDHVQAWKTPYFSLGCSLCRSEKLHMIREEAFTVHQAKASAIAVTLPLVATKGNFVPRLLRPDRREEVKAQKQMAAE